MTVGKLLDQRAFRSSVESLERSSPSSRSCCLTLRPVVFRYKPEVQRGERSLEYGLIAEEVAEVFPELVVDDERGEPFTVKYHLLSSMLLNELRELERESKDEQQRLELQVQALYYQDKAEEAERLCREMLAWSRANLGEDDYETAVNLLDLAIALAKQDRFDEAIPLAEEALQRVDEHFGEKSLPGVSARQTLSWILLQAGSAADAEVVAREALELAEAVLPREHHMRSRLVNDIGEALIAQGRPEEAVETLSSVLSEGWLGPEHPLTLAAQKLLAEAQRELDG